MSEHPGDRATYLRAAQHYGQILADLRRALAGAAAEQDAKIRAWQRTRTAATADHPAEPDEDFSTRTWLR